MAYQTSEIAELEYLLAKIEHANIPNTLREKIGMMIKRIRRMARQGKESDEYEEIAHYVDWVLAIPWGRYVRDNLLLENAKMVMDRFHHGREDVKKTILEYISVLNLKNSRHASNAVRTPILCFTGDQGTGKTTMAKAIAASLGRPFYRISMGALGSSSALRGKPMARYDAFPGEIVKALTNAKCMNPVILLDEFDKVSGDQGKLLDFMAVLLEVLDPQQNYAFRDHYIDYPIDLSQVFFITSANSLKPVTAALLDRLETVYFADYSPEEKIVIAQEYLLPKVLEKTAIMLNEIVFTKDIWPEIVRRGARGPGVRSLEKCLERIARKVAMKVVTSGVASVTISNATIDDFLPLPKISNQQGENRFKRKRSQFQKFQRSQQESSPNGNKNSSNPKNQSQISNQKEHKLPPMPDTAKALIIDKQDETL